MPDLDPGLSVQQPGGPIPDRCIYMRAIAGDTGAQANGARIVPAVWWLSPDIELTGPVSGADRADPPAPGQLPNRVVVRFNVRANCTPADTKARADAWICNPSLVVSPPNGVQIGTGLVTWSQITTKEFAWTLPTPTPPASDPQGPGHKCLVARCYPRNLTPDANDFHRVDDPHVAQRNICIVPCASPCGLDIETETVQREREEKVLIRAVADLDPDKRVLEVVLGALLEYKGFKRISREVPPFKLIFKDDREVKIVDRSSGHGDRARGPHFDAALTLKARERIRFRFQSDLERSQPGDAHIFHVVHVDAREKVQGGLTVVLLKGKR